MPKKKLKTSEAQAKARDKYDSKYRRTTIRLPIETADKIEDTGESLNVFINRAVQNELNKGKEQE